jgi:hypothetical protein
MKCANPFPTAKALPSDYSQFTYYPKRRSSNTAIGILFRAMT